MSLRLDGTISGCGRAAGAVIPSLGSGRYAPGPHIGLPSSLKCEAPKYTINACWGQPGSLATVSHLGYADSFGLGHHPSNLIGAQHRPDVVGLPGADAETVSHIGRVGCLDKLALQGG